MIILPPENCGTFALDGWGWLQNKLSAGLVPLYKLLVFFLEGERKGFMI